MPNIKSAIKRVGVNNRKRAANKMYNSALKTKVKKAELAISEGADNAADLVREAHKSIDKACAKGLLHKNTAARRKSRLAKHLQK
ncbi:MAG: 30S ribosomal protein S20 [Fastidiosipilaceae bacterium]|jgi:small subunit ribosomal protein S20